MCYCSIYGMYWIPFKIIYLIEYWLVTLASTMNMHLFKKLLLLLPFCINKVCYLFILFLLMKKWKHQQNKWILLINYLWIHFIVIFLSLCYVIFYFINSVMYLDFIVVFKFSVNRSWYVYVYVDLYFFFFPSFPIFLPPI